MKTFEIRRIFLLLVLTALLGSVRLHAGCRLLEWPAISTENMPGTRWWWLGSAVDERNLSWNLESLRKAGIGTVEITPIYGVQGKDSLEIPYLSSRWMSMLGHVQKEAQRLGMQVDMNGGTGWPFGGPEIALEHAASCQFVQTYELKPSDMEVKLEVKDELQKDVASLQALLFVSADGRREKWPLEGIGDWKMKLSEPRNGKLYALYMGKTFQKVKRAAPGGEGYVMNHLSEEALKVYLKKFDEAFAGGESSFPASFFNDSYEVYGADWSPRFLQEFKSRRGYDFVDYLPEWEGDGNPQTRSKLICDYRLTIAEMLMDNFSRPWTEWAHSHGVRLRNQAHGSPGNLLDFYALTDIPECESFGCSKFDIPGLRLDGYLRRNDGVAATLRYASSAAHVAGKPLVSSESMTWLTEHFRTSLALIKPEMDYLFVNGVNRVFYHGTPYTPQEAPWPGWMFYASIQANPNNTIFRDMAGLNTYISRVQSFLQKGRPDNELLLYFPVYDIWEKYDKTKYMTFDIHSLQDKLPRFNHAVDSIISMGYGMDYVSDAQLLETVWEKGRLKTRGAEYRSIMVPYCEVMPLGTLRKLLSLAEQGARLMFLGGLPSEVPGLHQSDRRLSELKALLEPFKAYSSSGLTELPYGKGRIAISSSLEILLEKSGLACEELSGYGAEYVRRQYEDGRVYFVSILKDRTIDGWVTLGTDAKAVALFNPMTGEISMAKMRRKEGRTQIYLQLKPGESMIIRCWDKNVIGKYTEVPVLHEKTSEAVALRGEWIFRFAEGWPGNMPEEEFMMYPEPYSWTELKEEQAASYAGTGVYTLSFDMPESEADDWCLDFGNSLYESARLRINDHDAGLVWAAPYRLNVGKYLKAGQRNEIEISVTNLPANLIADYDRRGVKWRMFKDINIVNIHYQAATYKNWEALPSGITASPFLIPLYKD